MKKLFLFALTGLMSIGIYAQTKKSPSFEEVISLQGVNNPRISPDGKSVVFTQSSVDWKDNRFDSELWLSKNGGAPFQLTNNLERSSSSPEWSPNGEWIAFLSRKGEKTQIQVIRFDGGESLQVTDTKGNISGFEWSPDGTQLAFLQSEDKSKEEKARNDKYGGFEIEDQEYAMTQLWLADFKPDRLGRNPLPAEMEDSVSKVENSARVLIESKDFTITGFEWSPDGKKIAFDHQPDPLINSFFYSDIAIFDIAAGKFETIVSNPSADGLIAWSPDSKSILYNSSLDDSVSNYYLNSQYFIQDIGNSKPKEIAKDFDENLSQLTWVSSGIYATAWQKTARKLVRVNPKNGKVDVVSSTPVRFASFSLNKDASQIAFAGNNDTDLTEIYLSDIFLKTPKKLTASTAQIQDWLVSDSEMISWKSKDGAVIEGVLHKPENYDPSKKYPLLVVIHGGPTGISTPGPAPAYVYPVVQWLNKGALVLMPNYRGSAGYGEDFRSLNVKNLGVGDAWDVESGVDYLISKGMVDKEKVGSMGWSQGGYISAFLATNSTKFKAISVGAGISNWMTYYVNTDIHPFTRQYLKATPWSDKLIYEKTSPMTTINNAMTPTLIQHGEFDKRVPPANAFELYQGLQDVGVPTKLIIYKGFGHGITKPKERLAAMWHNWQWFGEYIWDEEVEIPE